MRQDLNVKLPLSYRILSLASSIFSSAAMMMIGSVLTLGFVGRTTLALFGLLPAAIMSLLYFVASSAEARSLRRAHNVVKH